YFFIIREVEQLLNAYSSVNDPKTVQTVQALAAEKIRDILDHELPESIHF
ncbi:TPA: elongation factor G-binding protein, partial [Enterococcus faecium]|nr:elongation factor G-binding protein [Enterococcus faecium]